MRRTYLPGLAAGCLVLATLLVAGCGGGGGGSADSASANPPPASGNVAPTIVGTPGATVVVGQAYSFQPSANDANGDALRFTATNLPSWATLNAQTGRVSGTPTAAQVGAYANIGITVSDGAANASIGPFTITVTDMAGGSGSATLSWTPPTQNSNGTTLTNLAGYEVRYGQSADELGQAVTLSNPSINRYVVENLGSGTWFFAVVAVASNGATSALSETASKTIS
jgi:hypothetical protein